MLTEKYRPKQFKDLIGQDNVKEIVLSRLNSSHQPRAYFLTGDYGCGKTTTARLIARRLNCTKPKDGEPCGVCSSCKSMDTSHPDVTEINASDTRGIGDIRQLIGESNLHPRYKKRIYILDEVHQLTNQAQNALLKPLEDFSDKTVWILCTTDPHKVLKTIQSRCTKLKITKASIKDLTEHLKNISLKEGVNLDDKVFKTISEKSSGHIRDAVTVLDNIIQSLAYNKDADIYSLIKKIIEENIIVPPGEGAKKILKYLYTVPNVKSLYTKVLLLFNNVDNTRALWEELINYNDEAVNYSISTHLKNDYLITWNKTIEEIIKNNTKFKIKKLDFVNDLNTLQNILVKTYTKLQGWDSDWIFAKCTLLNILYEVHNNKLFGVIND